MRFARLLSRLSALLGLFVILQLVLALWSWQPEWFAQPQAALFAALWVIAGLAGTTVAVRAPQFIALECWERLPYWGGGLLLGFVVPGTWSVAAYMLLAATLTLIAAGLRAWRPRYALEALGIAVLTTGMVFALAWMH